MRLERIQLVINDTSRTQRHETSQSLAHHHRAIEGTLDQLFENHLGRHRILADQPNNAFLHLSNEPIITIPGIDEPSQSSLSTECYSDNIMAQTLRFSTSYQEPCELGCGCRCHNRQRWRNPSMLDKLIGTIFLGYVGLPIMSAKCDVHRCVQQRGTLVSFSYYFPAWFWMRILHIHIRHRQNLGLEQLLRVSRHVSAYSEILTYAANGNVEGVKSVLIDGRGSPFDVCLGSNRSALHVRYIIHSRRLAAR